MPNRCIVRVDLWDHGYNDEVSWTLPEAVAFFQKLNSQVPDEFKKDSVFRIEQEHDYYGGRSSLTVDAYYERPETDEEMASRIAHEKATDEQARRINEANQRRMYEELKRKFG